MARSSSGRGAQPVTTNNAATPAQTYRAVSFRLPRKMRYSMRTLTFLAAVLALVGCRTPLSKPAPLRPYTPPPPATEFLVKETRLAGGAVAVRADIPLVPSGPKPAVIALLGDTHQLVGAGFVTVTYSVNRNLLKHPQPPAPPAEETVGKWVLASRSASRLGETYLHEIAATADEYVPMILDWMQTLPEVDPHRIGMVGSSTNGFITLQATARDRRIRAAVAIAACGDYRDFLRRSSMGMDGKPLELDPSYARWIARQELVRHPQGVVHAAVLMVNRIDDPLIPVSCADATAEVLARAYEHAGTPERFRYVRVAEPGHGVGVQEGNEAMVWLQDWLLRS